MLASSRLFKASIRPEHARKKPSPNRDSKPGLLKGRANIDLELESFALFLDEDEKQDKIKRELSQAVKKEQKSVYRQADINPEKPSYTQDKRTSSSQSRGRPKLPTPIAASI